MNGYLLHFEGEDCEPSFFKTKKDIYSYLRSMLKDYKAVNKTITYKQLLDISYIVSTKDYDLHGNKI